MRFAPLGQIAARVNARLSVPLLTGNGCYLPDRLGFLGDVRDNFKKVRCNELVGSLIERIERNADESRSVTFVVGGQEQVVTWGELNRRAQVVAAELQSRSVKPGDHVAVLSSTSVDVVVAMQAVWLAGAVVVILPLPMRMASLGDFVDATKVRIAAADCSDMLVAPQFRAFVNEGEGLARHHDLAELLAVERSSDDLVRPTYSSDDLAILQFTSGSTSEPKGVMLPNHMIEANLDAMVGAVKIDLETDVLVSWLPLYHDMGLVGCCVLPMAEGMNLVLGSPQDFLSSPRSWMEWISRYSGTLTAGPNFSYVLASRGMRRANSDLDLSSLRLALNGAEPVDPACVRGFIEAGHPYGLRPGAAFPAFGMAELAIAGAFPEPMSGLQLDVIDGTALEVNGEARPVLSTDTNAREMVKLGTAVPGLSFRIVDEHGHGLPERKVGELQIKGSSVTTGYYNKPEATAELFDGDWLKSGDLGYLVDGQLVLCGRTKDLIIVGGRNIYPQDIERPVGLLSGVRAGNAVAFSTVGRKGKEEIVVVAECRVEPTTELLATVSDAVLEAVGVPCRDVVFVEPSTLPKTSSGKLQRALAKQHYVDDQLKQLPVAES